MFNDLHDFIFTDPKIPDLTKGIYRHYYPGYITDRRTREEIIEDHFRSSEKSETALLDTVCLQADG